MTVSVNSTYALTPLGELVEDALRMYDVARKRSPKPIRLHSFLVGYWMRAVDTDTRLSRGDRSTFLSLATQEGHRETV